MSPSATHRDESDQSLADALAAAVRRHGRDWCGDPRRCAGMLKDLLPGRQREVTLLVLAVEAGVVRELVADESVLPVTVRVEQCVRRLHDDVGVRHDVARRVVRLWAAALGIELPPDDESASATRVPSVRAAPRGLAVTRRTAVRACGALGVLAAVAAATYLLVTRSRPRRDGRPAAGAAAGPAANPAPRADGPPPGAPVRQPVTFSFDLRQPVPDGTLRTNASVHVEPSSTITYWAPVKTGEWATIAYKLSVPFPIAAVELRGFGVYAWNRHASTMFDKDSAAILEVSADGRQWTPVWSITPERGIQVNDAWVGAVRGRRELHLQARLFEKHRLNPAVHHAQFLRSDSPDRIPQVVVFP